MVNGMQNGHRSARKSTTPKPYNKPPSGGIQVQYYCHSQFDCVKIQILADDSIDHQQKFAERLLRQLAKDAAEQARRNV